MKDNLISDQKAYAMMLTPKEEFKSWLKSALLSSKSMPNVVDTVTVETLLNHSVTFLTPLLSTQELINQFIDENCELIFNTMLIAWPFPPDIWPTDRTRNTLTKLFDVSYYALVDIVSLMDAKERLMLTVTPIRPNQPFKDWINELDKKNKLIDKDLNDFDIDTLKKFGVALVTPDFKSKKEETKFIKDNYKTIFEMELSLTSDDTSTWPKDRSYETLLQWFTFNTCYPVIDLIKSEAIQGN